MGEEIIRDFAKTTDTKYILLRYFNPVGSHSSALIGEVPFGRPSNLIPAITQFASGKLKELKVFGTSYYTRDGSCIRDFVHVCDIASAHTKAIKALETNPAPFEPATIINLGTGNGITVLEAIHAFEKVAGTKLNYIAAPPREGDVVEIYADNTKAKTLLNWTPKYNIDDMLLSAWKWENNQSS